MIRAEKKSIKNKELLIKFQYKTKEQNKEEEPISIILGKINYFEGNIFKIKSSVQIYDFYKFENI